MRFAELLKKDLSELHTLRDASRATLEHLNRQLLVRGVKNVRELRVLRKDLARIETRMASLARNS